MDIGGVNKFHTFLHGVWIADTLRSSIKIVDCESPQKRVSQVTAAVRSPEDRRRVNVKRSATDLCALPCGCLASKGRGGLLFLYNSQLFTVRGNGIYVTDIAHTCEVHYASLKSETETGMTG